MDSGVFSALAYLERADPPHRLPMGELQRSMHPRYSQPGFSRLVQRMESDGLVERRPDPSDRRAMVVVSTRAGRQQFRSANAVYVEALHASFGEPSPRRRPRPPRRDPLPRRQQPRARPGSRKSRWRSAKRTGDGQFSVETARSHQRPTPSHRPRSSHGLETGTRCDPRHRCRPGQGVLRRQGRIRRRPRPHGERRAALRPAHTARLGVLDRVRQGNHRRPNPVRSKACNSSSPTSRPRTPRWPSAASKSATCRSSPGVPSSSSATPTGIAGPCRRLPTTRG